MDFPLYSQQVPAVKRYLAPAPYSSTGLYLPEAVWVPCPNPLPRRHQLCGRGMD